MRFTGCVAALVCAASTAYADNTTEPVSFFYTRPLSQAPAVNVSIQDGFSQGYVFIAPYDATHSGPYIYDKFGNLVWDGYGVTGSANAHDFRPCTYHGSPHLCFTQVNQQNGYGIGEGVIVNSDYKVVATAQTAGNSQPADMHEFQLLDDGETAILSSYEVVPYDLSAFNITTGLGWLSEGAFQVVNVTDGSLIFEWFSANHIDPSESQVLPNATDTDGNGFTPATAYDYFHINAIERTPSGNYLVSARHTSTIYSINGTDRSITWRLSYQGHSDFTCTNFNFSFQHDIRLRSENDTTTIISIFDNASNGFTNTTPQSSGKVIAIDHTTGNATMLQEILFPSSDDSGILSTSQGNFQILPDNAGYFVGWGVNPYFSEHALNGTATLLGSFPGVENYRAFSFPWESTPANTVPEVYAYAQSTTNSTRVYVSWNGATTVANWRVYGAQAVEDDFEALALVAHEGFETFWEAGEFYAWVRVEAVGPDGTGLRNSSFTGTFVPSEGLVGACTSEGCAVASSYGDKDEL